MMLLAFLVMAGAFCIDLALLRSPFLAEGRPNFSSIYLLRTLLVALASWLFVAGVAHRAQLLYTPARWKEVWNRWGCLRWTSSEEREREYARMSLRQLVVWAMVLLGSGLVLLFLARPIFFSRMGREDRLVETLSAMLHLLNSGLFALLAYQLLRSPKGRWGLSLWPVLALASLFFLIGMEEVSWFQRYLGFAIPEAFAANKQKELNLHNFHTGLAENGYYFLFFVFLIATPFLAESGLFPTRHPVVNLMTPSRFIVPTGALFVAYNYDMWNILLTQVAFFTTIFILVHYVREARDPEDGRTVLFAALAVLVLSQGVFLAFGHRFVRVWDVTEYKELLIPLACVFYTLGVLHRFSTGTALVRGADGTFSGTAEIRPARGGRAAAG